MIYNASMKKQYKRQVQKMRKVITVFLMLIMTLSLATGCAGDTNAIGELPIAKEEKQFHEPEISLSIGSDIMIVDGKSHILDTPPILHNQRTLLPIRSVVNAMGGQVEWDAETKTVIIAKENTIILFVIDSVVAFVNEVPHILDVPPILYNSRTMLPIRFIAENLGYGVEWEDETRTVRLSPNVAGIAHEPDSIEALPNKTLVAYFSCTGNTRSVALEIAELIQADVYEIIPAEPYTSSDINYRDNSCRANREQSDSSSRPKIAGTPIDLSEYSTIILGFPIWHGTAPRIIQTFLDDNELLAGKTVLPFATSGSTGISSAVSLFKEYCPNAEIRNGYRSPTPIDKDALTDWLYENNIEIFEK